MGAVSAVAPESMAVGTKAFIDKVLGVARNLDFWNACNARSYRSLYHDHLTRSVATSTTSAHSDDRLYVMQFRVLVRDINANMKNADTNCPLLNPPFCVSSHKQQRS